MFLVDYSVRFRFDEMFRFSDCLLYSVVSVAQAMVRGELDFLLRIGCQQRILISIDINAANLYSSVTGEAHDELRHGIMKHAHARTSCVVMCSLLFNRGLSYIKYKGIEHRLLNVTANNSTCGTSAWAEFGLEL